LLSRRTDRVFRSSDSEDELDQTNGKHQSKIELVEAKADGTETRVVTALESVPFPFDFECPAWSPDGRVIIVTSHPVHDKTSKLLEVDVRNGRQRVLNPSITTVFSYPQWLPSGREIAFIYQDTKSGGGAKQVGLLSYPLMQLRCRRFH
jgi:Tol biopolymer transport system component